MKFLDDILQSISGNTKTKIEDPFIGAFLGAWIICNWGNLALLVWGEGTAAERISKIGSHYQEMKIWDFNSLVAIPALMTAVFIFVFPWISLLLKSIQKFANERLHKQAISVEVGKVQQQEKLNKLRLKADPEKEFLAQSVKLDIEKEKELAEQLRLQTAKLKEETDAAMASSEAAAAAAKEAKSRAKQAEIEEVKKKANAELEKQRFSVASAQLKSAQASNRFPSVYSLMNKIEESLKEDGIQLSLAGLGNILAMVFGYDNFESLVHDENFNNKTLAQVAYIYYDRDEFALMLETIIQNESADNEYLSTGILFDHVMSIFDNDQFKLLPNDEIEDVCREICENMKYDLLNGEELSGPIAESDTSYDEVEIGELDDITFDKGLSVTFSGSASGTHRRDSDVPGRDIEFSIEIKNALIVGTRGLGEFEQGDISANLIEFDNEDEYEPAAR